MLNQAYAIRQFHENISQTNTIKQLKTLIKGNSCLDLSVFLEGNAPISLCWDARSDSFTGNRSLTIFPKLVINGELYEAPFRHDLVMPPSFDGLESAFIKTLKESLGTAQRVWD